MSQDSHGERSGCALLERWRYSRRSAQRCRRARFPSPAITESREGQRWSSPHFISQQQNSLQLLCQRNNSCCWLQLPTREPLQPTNNAFLLPWQQVVAIPLKSILVEEFGSNLCSQFHSESLDLDDTSMIFKPHVQFLTMQVISSARSSSKRSCVSLEAPGFGYNLLLIQWGIESNLTVIPTQRRLQHWRKTCHGKLEMFIEEVWTCKKLYYGSDSAYPELKSYSHRCGPKDHHSQPQFPLPVIWCECKTNPQLPHFLFLQSSSWHPECYSNTGKASSEQCYPKDTAKVPGHMLNLLLQRILPHWESVGVSNNNSCTHCFLGETHQDGIVDKQLNSQGSWTSTISYLQVINSHSKATRNQITYV